MVRIHGGRASEHEKEVRGQFIQPIHQQSLADTSYDGEVSEQRSACARENAATPFAPPASPTPAACMCSAPRPPPPASRRKEWEKAGKEASTSVRGWAAPAAIGSRRVRTWVGVTRWVG